MLNQGHIEQGQVTSHLDVTNFHLAVPAGAFETLAPAGTDAALWRVDTDEWLRTLLMMKSPRLVLGSTLPPQEPEPSPAAVHPELFPPHPELFPPLHMKRHITDA